MTKRATMQDVADTAGVGIATVDRILNRRAPVKRATVELVLAAAERVGYHGIPTIHDHLTEHARPATFGFILNGRERGLYAELAKSLSNRTRASRMVRGKAIVRHLDSIGSIHTAQVLMELAEECDAIAVVAVDTPEVNAAIEKVAASGIPVFAMFSDVSSPHRAGFVGSDAIKIGRGAGWMVERLSPRSGVAAVIIGSSEYAAHQGYACGFREFLRDRNSSLQMLDAGETLESDAAALRITEALLAECEDLVAILVAGGGLGGAASALLRSGRSVVLVGTELSAEIDTSLFEGTVDAVLSHPLAEVAARTVAAMEASVTTHGSSLSILDLVPIQIRISETV